VIADDRVARDAAVAAVAALNALPPSRAAELFRSCCGSSRWVTGMVERRPFASREAVLRAADDIWRSLGSADWREAFAHHPRIGEQRSAVPQGRQGQTWSAGEQSGMDAAESDVRGLLAEVNREYEARFGYIYIVCATGKSADEMLAIARRRLGNDPDTELAVAADEQRRIMHLRLEKLLDGSETEAT
jgi:OHCU decarboxylase